MADLTLRIAADFEKAQKAFNELADSSEETKKKMEAFSESFQNKNIDSFIDKQKLLEVSLTGTRGETKAMQQSVNNYQKEIERLIKSGLDPNSDAVQKLAKEQDKLKQKIKEAADVQKMQENIMKGAEKACLAMWAAIGAGIAATLALTQKTAELGDELTKSSQRLGVTVEGLQELDYAANQSGIKDLRTHLNRLNKTMGEVKSGTGSLTSFLKQNDKQLLNQLKNVKSNEEAFMLLMDSVSQAPDEFTKAKLATEYFGRAGQDLIIMANQGADGIQALREEAQKYGVMSTQAAKQAEEYLDAQTRLKAALQGVATELTAALMPSITDTINNIADFIAGIDDWEKKLKTIAVVIGTVTAALTIFIGITKLSGVVTGFTAGIAILTKAFAAFNAVLLANPLVLIITAIVAAVAMLATGIITIIKKWDILQTYLMQGLARVEFAFKFLAINIKQLMTIAFNAIKIAGASLLDFIYGNIIRGVGQLLEVMGKLPFVGDMFNDASQQVMRLGNAIGNIAEETRRNSQEIINASREEIAENSRALHERLANIDAEARARRTVVDDMERQTEEEMGLQTEAAEHEISERERALNQTRTINNQIAQEQIKNLKDRLNEIALTERQAMNQQISEVTNFLEQRARLETNCHSERIEFLLWQKEELLLLYEEGSQERIAIEKAADEAIRNSKEELAKREMELYEQRANAAQGFFNGVGQLLQIAGEKNKKAAIAAKAFAMVESGINTALAATKSLTAAPFPWNMALMAGTIAAGTAQQIKIVSSSIPSAETGGRFIVPHTNSVDGALLRVNQDEEVNITPRGQTGGDSESFNFNLIIDSEVIAKVTNKLARAGELHTLQLAGNI